MRNAGLKMAAVAAAMAVTAPAAAATTVSTTFATVGTNKAVTGTYGNTVTFNAGSSSLQLTASAWQSNLLTSKISTAYLGAYAGGIGVTGAGDLGGAYNLHQVDNVGLYTDFVLLQFNRPVTLTSITTNSYGIGGMFDNDAVWYDASALATSTWNATGAASASLTTSGWHDVSTGLSGATRTTGATTASTQWLVAPEFLPLSARDTGFKIASITVTETVAAVPEPATWATTILGVGLVGAALRRRRSAVRVTAARA